jgi:hypothetical protein
MDTPRTRKPFVDALSEHVKVGLYVGLLGSVYNLEHGYQALYTHVPRTFCSAVGCFGLYTTIDYAMVSARGKEEPFLDCAVAAAGASAITFLPRGVRFAGASALVCGALGGVLLGGCRFIKWKLESIEDP